MLYYFAVKKGGKESMTEVVCVAAGVVAGGFMGVVVMSIMQINRINQYERRIMKLKKQLEASRK